MPNRFSSSSSSSRQISAIWLNLAHLILLATSSCLSRAAPPHAQRAGIPQYFVHAFAEVVQPSTEGRESRIEPGLEADH